MSKTLSLMIFTLISAAWCHDVLEDCPQVKEATLRLSIGSQTAARTGYPIVGHPTIVR